MPESTTVFAGVTIPSTHPLFLAILAVHVPLGLFAVVTGVAAMLSRKAPGRHPRFGTMYFWSLGGVFVSATALSAMRWAEAYHLFVLGAIAFAAAILGRGARRRRRPGWEVRHIAFMGASYVVMLTAFYVDNGKQLPLWRELPAWTYWVIPALVGAPIIAWALLRHPLVKRAREPGKAS
ncbi:MAG TPA: DUF2306 domain-containing protein [Gammaproteobacteria bacterium]|nr:DUF2306 domain-containing protein [Gammaproteobacteria bacterium]